MTEREKEVLRAIGISDWMIEMAEMKEREDDDGGY